MQSERLTSTTPLMVTAIMILLIIARASVWCAETYMSPAPNGVKWQEPSRADLAGVRDYQPKMVFYYFCEPDSESCRRAEHGALLSKDVVKVVNDNFLAIKVLTGTGTGLGDELKQRFGVLMCPTFVIVLPSGSQIGTEAAYFGVSTQSLLSFIRKCRLREGYVTGLDYLARTQYQLAAQAFKKWLQINSESGPQVVDGVLYCALADLMLFKEKKRMNYWNKLETSNM